MPSSMKKYNLLLVFALIFSGALQAQKNMEEIDFDDLKNKKLVSEFIWSDFKKFQDYPVVPEEFNDEVAVYLEKEFYYSFKARMKSGSNVLKIRKMYRWIIKIQQDQGIEEFSTLRFYAFDEKKDQIGIRLIKANGSIVNIDDSRLLDDEDENGAFKKVSIPNLETGDIIDYYRYDNYKKVFYSQFSIFSPSYEVFVSDFPIVHQYLEFDLINNVYMLFSEFNDAPTAKVSENDKGVDVKIVYENTMIEKNDIKGKWINNLSVFPGIRYQVGAGKTPDGYLNQYLFSKGKYVTFKRSKSMLNELLREESGLFEVDKYGKKRNKAYNKKIATFYEGKKAPSKLERIEYVYNTSRFYDYNSISYLQGYLLDYLQDQGINYTIFHYIPKYLGDYHNILSRQDIEIGLKFNIDEKEYYYSNNRVNSVLGEIPPYFEGLKGYGVDFKNVLKYKKRDQLPIKEVFTPVSTPDRNAKNSTYEIVIDGEDLKVKSSESYVGQLKRKRHYYLPTDMSIIEDLKKYNVKEKDLLKEYPDYKEDYEKFIHVSLLDTTNDDEEMADYKYYFKMGIINNYDDGVKEVNAFDVKSTGRYIESPSLTIESDYIIEGFVKKMGADYLIDAGKLIGGQVNLDDDEREREVAISQDYVREFKNEISILIPEGYTVEGMEKMNVSVDNSNGRFIAITKVEGNQLLISTIKSYKKLDSPIEEWEEYLNFLDASYDFTQQKLLLKKG